MSTRSSIVHIDTGMIHIYEEMISNEICIGISAQAKMNEKYQDPVISKQELKQIYLQLKEYYENELTDEEKAENRRKNEEWMKKN